MATDPNLAGATQIIKPGYLILNRSTGKVFSESKKSISIYVLLTNEQKRAYTVLL